MPLSRDKKTQYNKSYYLRKKHKRRSATGEDEKKVLWSGRLPETLIARIQRVTLEGVATGRYPWKSMTEAVTNLIQRGFASLKGDPFIDEMLPHLEMAQHLDRIRNIRREAASVLNTAKSEIAELLNIGAVDGAVRYYHMTMEAAHRLPPTEWRDWLITEMKKAFPELARGKVKGVSLMEHKKPARKH